MSGLGRLDHVPGDFQYLLPVLFPDQSGGLWVELEPFDDGPEDFAQGAGAQPVVACRSVGDQESGLFGDGEGDTGVLEVVDGDRPDGTRNVVEYPDQVGRALR